MTFLALLPMNYNVAVKCVMAAEFGDGGGRNGCEIRRRGGEESNISERILIHPLIQNQEGLIFGDYCMYTRRPLSREE